ncbi:myosin head, partial [Dictyocaulus viviparus]
QTLTYFCFCCSSVKFLSYYFFKDKVAGGFVSHYLLERSRLCRQADGERNYHIFYQLIAGAPDYLFQKLHLDSPQKFKYLNHGAISFFTRPGSTSKIDSRRLKREFSSTTIITDAIVDDYADFSHLVEALARAGFEPNEVNDIWRVVAGILHLGNIDFIANMNDSKGGTRCRKFAPSSPVGSAKSLVDLTLNLNGCIVEPETESSLMIAAELLGLEMADLKLGLVTRIMQATKGGVKGTLIRVPLKPHEAVAGRDALTKALYSRLFDWLVARINKSIPSEKSTNYIGVLDIAGFEFFEVNSFEQFCINFCNEKLQHFFNERILKQEQELYAKEGLDVPRIEYSDNHDCIELFEMKSCGLLDLLDEEARLPRPSSQHFTAAVYEANKGHFRLEVN